MESNKDLLKLENEFRDEVSHQYKEKPVMRFTAGQSCSSLKERITKLLEKSVSTSEENSSTSQSSGSQTSQVEMDIYLVDEGSR